MTSKAERKRKARESRERFISLAGGESIPQRPTGRDRTHTNKPAEDPRKTALEARCRKQADLLTPGQAKAFHASLSAALAIETPAERKAAIGKLSQMVNALRMKAADDELIGSDMGRCIRHVAKGTEQADLKEAWAAISASFRNYRLLVIGQTGDPQGAAIGMVPEPMETDPSLRVDLRTIEEKVAAAKSSKAAWDARINALPVPNMKWALRGALNGFMGEDTLWRDKVPTPTGRLAVEALRRVME